MLKNCALLAISALCGIFLEDAISAMRWVRANAGKLGVDLDRIATGGSSAGGYFSVAT